VGPNPAPSRLRLPSQPQAARSAGRGKGWWPDSADLHLAHQQRDRRLHLRSIRLSPCWPSARIARTNLWYI